MPQDTVSPAAGQIRANSSDAAVTTRLKEQTSHDPGT